MAALPLRLMSPMAMAQAARSLSSLTICSSNASILLRQSAMSIVVGPHINDTGWSRRSCVHLAGDLVCIVVRRVVVSTERTDELADDCGGLLGRCALDERDDGAADDGCIGKVGDSAHVLGVGDAKAERDGELRELLEAAHELFRVCGELGLRAGDADARDGVDEA